MKKIYLSVLASLAFILAVASPDVYTPELVAPENNEADISPNVVLDWNAVTGQLGLYYEVQLSLDAAFTAPMNFTTDLTAYENSNLLFGQTYFWRVRAKDDQGVSGWSDSRSFTTIVKPVFRRPNDNSTGAMPNVLILWEEVTGVAHYDIQMDLVNTFDSPELKNITAAGNLKEVNASGLLFGAKYYLRMRARHATDTSEWAVVRNFTVLNVLTLKKPDSNTTDILAPDVQFEWTRVDGIEKYNIYISTDEAFAHYDTYATVKSLVKYIPDTLHFGTQYFWKMAAIHSMDTLNSVQRTFSVVSNVALSAPLNSSTNVELLPFLKWNKISGVLSYKLQLASNAAMNNAYNYSIVATTTLGLEQFKVPINVLDSAATYYWRVSAISSSDTSAWSDTWNFRCVALGIDHPSTLDNLIGIYPIPAVNSVNIQLKGNFSGKAVVSLYDLLGKARIEREVQIVNGIIKDFQLGVLPDGIYMLRTDVNGTVSTAKLVVKK